MKLNLKNPIVFFDLETTGIDVVNDRIVEISLVKIGVDGTKSVKTRRINPEMHIPEAATAVHGITDEDVKDEPTFRQIAKSHVSLSVTNLEQRGLLTRGYDPDDRRTAHLQLTDAAREITAEGARLQEQFFGCVFSGLSEEEMALWRSILERVCANISNL